MNVQSLKLCLVTDFKNLPFHLYEPVILKAIQGGVTAVQLRGKNESVAALTQLAMQLKSLLDPYKIPLIINDHVDIAKQIGDGVHLGQTDLSPEEARRLLGPQKIIGWSVGTLAELERANQLTCIDYIAASAVFPSKTKPDCKTIWGIDGLQKMVSLSKHPVMAIGGIHLENVAAVMASGAACVAVVSAIHDHDPRQAAKDLIAKIDFSIQLRSKTNV